MDNWVDGYMFVCFVAVCVSQSYGQPSQGMLVYLILGLEAPDLPTGLLIEPLLTGGFNLNLLLPQFSVLFFQHGHFLFELSQFFQQMAVENAETPRNGEPSHLPSTTPSPFTTILERSQVGRQPQSGATKALPISLKGRPNPNNTQIPEIPKVLLQMLTPKGNYVPPKAGSGFHLCLSVLTFRKTTSDRGHKHFGEDRKANGNTIHPYVLCNPALYSPFKKSRGLGLNDNSLGKSFFLYRVAILNLWI